jgi:hypothetical protein
VQCRAVGVVVVSAIVLAACSSTDGDANPDAAVAAFGERVVFEPFDIWPTQGVDWFYPPGSGDPSLDTSYGSPAPSVRFVYGNGYFELVHPVAYDHQAFAASADIKTVATFDNYHTFRTAVELAVFVRSTATRVGTIRLVTQHDIAPAVATVTRLQCTEDPYPMDAGTVLPTTFVLDAPHAFQLEANVAGLHARLDGIEYCLDPLVMSATGDVVVKLTIKPTTTGSSMDGTSVNNVAMYRGH